MKRHIVLSVILMIVASACVTAQKSKVKSAERIVKSEKPDFSEAKALIEEAKANPESSNEAYTWYVSGLIDNTSFNKDKIKMALNQPVDLETAYKSLMSMYPNMIVADSLDNLPNAKGKVKPRYFKKIKEVFNENYGYYINAGAWYFDEKRYDEAHKAFRTYLDIRDSKFFVKDDAISAHDSIYEQIAFFSASAASQLSNPDLAIAEYESIKGNSYRQNELYQALSGMYLQKKDTLGYVRVLEEGQKLFPTEIFFIYNLVSAYMMQNEPEKANQMVDNAININPNDAKLYRVKGYILEQNSDKREEAIALYKKSIEIDPEYADALSDLGRMYYNRAVQIQSDANSITDQAKYVELDKQAKELYRQAMPYFEKAHKLNPDASEPKVALRSIYYMLELGDKMKAIEAEMGITE